MLRNRITTKSTALNDYVRSRISVLIPTYNYSQFLLDAVKSVLAQDVPDVEIIVVDDGSTDNTSDIIKPYTDRVQYIYQENAGLSAARNTGIRNSTGEFILFLDADDVLGTEAIASQVALNETLLPLWPYVKASCSERRIVMASQNHSVAGHCAGQILGFTSATSTLPHLMHFSLGGRQSLKPDGLIIS